MKRFFLILLVAASITMGVEAVTPKTFDCTKQQGGAHCGCEAKDCRMPCSGCCSGPCKIADTPTAHCGGH